MPDTYIRTITAVIALLILRDIGAGNRASCLHHLNPITCKDWLKDGRTVKHARDLWRAHFQGRRDEPARSMDLVIADASGKPRAERVGDTTSRQSDNLRAHLDGADMGAFCDSGKQEGLQICLRPGLITAPQARFRSPHLSKGFSDSPPLDICSLHRPLLCRFPPSTRARIAATSVTGVAANNCRV